MVLFDGVFVIAETDVDFVAFPLRLQVVLLEHLQIDLALFLFSCRHFVDDLDNAVDEEYEEEDHHQDGDVGVDNRRRVPGGEVPVPHGADRLQAPVSSIVEPDVPGKGLDEVQVKGLPIRCDTSSAGLTGEPVVLTRPRSIVVVVIVDGEEDGGEPEYDEDNDDFKAYQAIEGICVGMQLESVAYHFISMKQGIYVGVEEDLEIDKIWVT